MIAQEQESKLRPILNKLLPVLCMDVFGAVPDDLDFEFDPVSEPPDQERSDLAKSGTENVVTALNAGLVSPRTALKELKQQSERTGVWTNITDADILKASDEVQGEGELGGFEDMDSIGGGEGQPVGHAGPQRPPQDPGDKPPEDPGNPPENPKEAADSASFYNLASDKMDAKGNNHDEGNGQFVPKNGGGPNIKKPKAPKYTKAEGYKHQIGEPIPGEHHGIDAINILLSKHAGYVPETFTRRDIGNIALPWGDDWMGLKHIIQERESQGIKPEDFLPKLPDIIENGELTSRNGRYYIRKDYYTAVVSPTYFDDQFTFLLTGWDETVPKAAKKR